MSIKILGGDAKGLLLESPQAHLARPTSVLLRRKIFDANQNMSNKIFIDLCAGTSAMGLEALSRGAQELICIEQNVKVFKILSKNISLFERKIAGKKITKVKSDCFKWLESYQEIYESLPPDKKNNTVLFFDPPYEEVKLYEKLSSLSLGSWFKGALWIEACRQKTMVESQLEQLFENTQKVYRQGTSYLVVCDFTEKE